MGLKILKSTEKIDVKSIKVLIYGEPGVGKTTVSLTSMGALCLDCDGGVHRATRNADALEIENYDSILELFQSDEGVRILRQYKTIVVDTAGALLSYMSDHIRRNETKVYGATRSGMFFNPRSNALTLQGYGVLKSVFKNFLESLFLMRKDVIFIAHESIEKNGEIIKKIPSITGGSYDMLLQSMDLIGYMFFENVRIIDFSPSPSHYGKDCAGLGRTPIPTPLPNNFFTDVINRAKSGMGKAIAVSGDINNRIEHFSKKITNVNDAGGANFILQEIWAEAPAVQAVAKEQLYARAKELELEYDKDAKIFTNVKNV